MPFVVPDEGERYLLDVLLKVALAVSDNWILHLYVNDVDIETDTVLADLDEAFYDGYAPVELIRSDWSDAATIGERAVSSWGSGPVSFVADSGDQDVYGWYVTDSAETVILWAERLASAPFNVSTTNPLFLTPINDLASRFNPS